MRQLNARHFYVLNIATDVYAVAPACKYGLWKCYLIKKTETFSLHEPVLVAPIVRKRAQRHDLFDL
jgi:hypothetical protein